MDVEIRQLHPFLSARSMVWTSAAGLMRWPVHALWEAIDCYAVLVLHDQRLNDERLRDFARNFGKLEIGRSAAEGGKRRLALPEIGDISNLMRRADCAHATTAGVSTASATACGTPMLPTCQCRWCWECCMRSQCRPRAR